MLDLIPRLLSLVSLAPSLVAQIGGSGADGPLVVTQGTLALDTTLRPNGFDYTTITIAAGAELRLTGTNPARLRAQGAVTIDGWLDADGFATTTSAPGRGGPGGFDGGAGGMGAGGLGQGPGGGCFGWASGSLFSPPGPASHATLARAISWCGRAFGSAPPAYGSAWPFDLRGGSGAGGFANPVSWGTPGAGGAGGGGTILIAADGPVVVRGRISAKPPANSTPAASGSILIQTTATLRIEGIVDASETAGAVAFEVGGAGFIRFDTHGDPATVSGGVTPAPTAVVLPRFRDVDAPQVGLPWRIQIDAWPSDVLAVWLAGRATSLPFPPFGTLRLDVASGIALLGVSATVPSATGLEATASLIVAVPADPNLRGIVVHAQALQAITRAPTPKFSELLTRTLQ